MFHIHKDLRWQRRSKHHQFYTLHILRKETLIQCKDEEWSRTINLSYNPDAKNFYMNGLDIIACMATTNSFMVSRATFQTRNALPVGAMSYE